MRLAVILFLLIPSVALGGAWPRQQGQTFIAVSHEGDEDGWTGFYLEHGGPRRLTFGIDAGGRVAGTAAGLARGQADTPRMQGRAIAFVRIPLRPEDGRVRYPRWEAALELGAGLDFDLDDASETGHRLRVGLSVGRGLETPFGNGWLNLDARVEPGAGETRYSIASVVGFRPWDRVTFSFAVAGEAEDEITAAISPAISIEIPILGEAQVGVRFKSTGETRVFLGLARTF